MTHKEIIDIEQENTGYINLHLEGTFYKAYEQSAFAFCTRIKAYNVLRKESKTLGRDILYVGFPQSTLDKVLNRQMFTRVDEKTVRITLSTPIDGNEFLVRRDAQEVEQASRAMLTPYSRVIENAPVYKTAYDVLTQITLISKNCQTPFGVRLKERRALIERALPVCEELCFLLQFLKDIKEISLNSYSMLSEKIQSVSKQLSLLRRKITSPVPDAVVCPNGRFLRSRTRRHLDRRWTEALCTETDPYVLLSVRNAREGFLIHFDGGEKETI